jgi:hypothetical protein
MPGYYDIDVIIAEEQAVPCQTLFDFSYLSHLHPDYDKNLTKKNDHVLPENSKIQVPIWVVSKWAPLNFVRMSLPKSYGRTARERWQADPASLHLPSQFFSSGRALVQTAERSCWQVAKSLAGAGRMTSQLAALDALRREARDLRSVLLAMYTGRRLQQTLDWALSSPGDDVSAWTGRLDCTEMKLYRTGADAAAGHAAWKRSSNSRRSAEPAAKRQRTQ